MAQVIVDNVALREEGLLTPGKKPVGNVKIDWSHPLTDKLEFCVLARNSDDSRVLIDTPNTAHPKWAYATKLGGMGANFFGRPGSSTPNRDYLLNKTLTNELTVYQIIEPRTLWADGVNQHFLDADADNTNREWQLKIIDSSGNWRFVVWNGIISAETTGGAPANILHKVWGSVSDINDTVKCRINGETASTAYTDTLIGCTYVTLSFTRSTVREIDGLFHFACIWNKQLTSAEMDRLDADPYQFLIPA